jgi:hypothetical protein
VAEGSGGKIVPYTQLHIFFFYFPLKLFTAHTLGRLLPVLFFAMVINTILKPIDYILIIVNLNAFLLLASQCYRFPLRRGLSFFHFLKDYHEEHPEVTVLDPPNAIEHLNNRQSMLEEVADLNLSNFYGMMLFVYFC